MGIATLLSRIAGLAREQVFAFFFGASHAMDAFNIAFRIPNLLRDLFAEGAMSASLVPTFTEVREREGDERAWQVAGRVFRILFILVAIISVLGIIYSPWLVGLYAGHYRSEPGKFELTLGLTRVLFLFFPLVALAAAYMAVLNSCHRFFWPAFASALFNVTSIVTGVLGVWLCPKFGMTPIYGMALGVVFGGAVQAFCQLPILYSVGYRYTPVIKSGPAAQGVKQMSWSKDPALRKMLKLMIPGMIGLAATQINVLVNSVLATSMGQGAVSWLNYSFRLMQFPIGIFGVSLASATLPKLTREWVRGDIVASQQTLENSIKLVFAVNLPASAGLAFLGAPIIALLFEHGRFGGSDTSATAQALAAYAIGLTAYSVVKILVPICYAMGRSQLPVMSSFVTVGVSICLSLFFSQRIGFMGLALATSLSAFLNAAILAIGIEKEFRKRGQNGLPWLAISKSFGVYLAASLLMGVSCLVTYRILSGHLVGHLGITLNLVACLAEGILLILVLARFLGLKELNQALEIVSKKLKNRVR